MIQSDDFCVTLNRCPFSDVASAIILAPNSSPSLLFRPLPVTESSTGCAASTKIYHQETAQGCESISCLNGRFPSQNRCLRPALSPSTYNVGCLCCPIPRWSPCPLRPAVDDESRALGSFAEQFFFELLFSFFRTIIGYNRACVSFVVRALSSDLSPGILRAGANVRRHLCSTLAVIERPHMRRIPTCLFFALCIATSPLCAKSQVSTCDTCELGMRDAAIGGTNLMLLLSI